MKIKKQVGTILSNEKGFVLPVGLMFLAIIALLGTTSVIVTTTDIKIGSNYRASEQAFYVAEAGIQRGINYLKNNAGNSFNDELLGSDGFSVTADDGILDLDDDGILDFGMVFGDGTYAVQVIDNNDEIAAVNNLYDDIDDKVIIKSIGTVNGAVKTIEVVFGTGSLDPDGALGVYGPNNPTIDIHGNPTIDGWDYDPPTKFKCSGAHCNGTINGKPGVPGIYTEQSSPIIDGTVSPDLSTDPNVDGDPASQYSGGNNTDWQAVASKLIPQADNIYTGGGNVTGNIELGNRTTPGITVVETSSGSKTKFAGNVDGAGILIVHGDGDADFHGSFHWEGIIIVISDSGGDINFHITGNAHIFGAFVSTTTAGGTVDLDLTGNPDMVYSSKALTYANDVYKIVYSWKDDSL